MIGSIAACTEHGLNRHPRCDVCSDAEAIDGLAQQIVTITERFKKKVVELEEHNAMLISFAKRVKADRSACRRHGQAAIAAIHGPRRVDERTKKD